jgi:hypothetical protein
MFFKGVFCPYMAVLPYYMVGNTASVVRANGRVAPAHGNNAVGQRIFSLVLE